MIELNCCCYINLHKFCKTYELTLPPLVRLGVPLNDPLLFTRRPPPPVFFGENNNHCIATSRRDLSNGLPSLAFV